MVPTGIEKTGKMGNGKSQGILSRREKSGNYTENTGKSEKIILEK